MWAHGEEALAKSLVACKLYKAMAHEAAEDDLDTEIYDELKAYAKDFEAKGIKLLDFCYRQDADRAQRLLTCELQSWSNQSCLSLAVAANHRPLLAHSCSQVILADLWMGGLRTRKNTNLKVIGVMYFPGFMKHILIVCRSFWVYSVHPLLSDLTSNQKKSYSRCRKLKKSIWKTKTLTTRI